MSELTLTMNNYDDDYVLTPLTESDDVQGAEGAAMEDDAVMKTEDYVQSLVTIESNWANGKFFFFSEV